MAVICKSRYPLLFVAVDVTKHKEDSGSGFSSSKICKACEKVGEKDFERQKQKRSTATYSNEMDDSDKIHRVMMELEPLLEPSGKRNWRSIMLTHTEFPCHCLLQTWWYPEQSNLVLIWNSRELLSIDNQTHHSP